MTKDEKEMPGRVEVYLLDMLHLPLCAIDWQVRWHCIVLAVSFVSLTNETN